MEELLNEKINASMLMGSFLGASYRVRSLARAYKRGRITQYGLLIPKRPFNNRANTSKRKDVHSRTTNEQKKLDYEYAKRRAIK